MKEKLKKQTETIKIKEVQSFVKKGIEPHFLLIDSLGMSISNSAGVKNPTITKSKLDEGEITYSTKIQQVLDEKYKDVEDFTRSTQHYTRNLMTVIFSNIYKLTDNIDRRALISSLYMVRDYVELVDNIQPYRTIFGGKEMFLKSAAQSLIIALKSLGYQRLMQNVMFNEWEQRCNFKENFELTPDLLLRKIKNSDFIDYINLDCSDDLLNMHFANIFSRTAELSVILDYYINQCLNLKQKAEIKIDESKITLSNAKKLDSTFIKISRFLPINLL